MADDAKQREKMAGEFYALARREAQEYQEKAAYLIDSGCQSAAIMERWVRRIEDLKEKKTALRGAVPEGADGDRRGISFPATVPAGIADTGSGDTGFESSLKAHSIYSVYRKERRAYARLS